MSMNMVEERERERWREEKKISSPSESDPVFFWKVWIPHKIWMIFSAVLPLALRSHLVFFLFLFLVLFLFLCLECFSRLWSQLYCLWQYLHWCQLWLGKAVKVGHQVKRLLLDHNTLHPRWFNFNNTEIHMSSLFAEKKMIILSFEYE